MRCDGKSTFPGRGSARRYARRLADRYGSPLREYFCAECHRWHLTSTPRPLTRTAEAELVPASSTRYRRGRRPAPDEDIEELAARMRAARTDQDSQ